MSEQVKSLLTMYAISPIHAGSGSSTGAVDLPIQREKHTNYPVIVSSGVKGALRDHYRNFCNITEENHINKIFGYDAQDNPDGKVIAKDNASAISFSDAKLLLFPMRSNIAPFVWVTCPAVLKRFCTDLQYLEKPVTLQIPAIEQDTAVCLIGTFGAEKIILEEWVIESVKKDEQNVYSKIKDFLPTEADKILLVHDNTFKYCVDFCTQIQTQIKIDADKGTAQDGALRYIEFLQSDSVLYTIVNFGLTNSANMTGITEKEAITPVIKDFVQIGGHSSIGCGICKINWIDGE